DELDTVILEDPLRAADRVALAIEEVLDAAQKIDVIGPVVAPAAATFQRLDLLKPRLPEAQDVLRQVQIVRDFADCPECIRRLFTTAYPLLAGRGLQRLPPLLAPRDDPGKPPPCYGVPPPEFALIRCFRIADGLNTITRRGEIGTSFPVFGLRPIRCPFLRTTKEPNDDNFTVSPRSRQSVISLSTSSTSADDSVRDRPTFWYTASHRSARVTVFPVIAQPQSRQ